MNTAPAETTETVANITARQLAYWTKARLGVKGMIDMGELEGSRGALKLVLIGSKRFQMLIILTDADLYTVAIGYVGRGKRAGEWIEPVARVEMVDAVSLNRVLEDQFAAAMRALS